MKSIISMKKDVVKTSIIQQPNTTLDEACPICHVDVGTKSPEGVKEKWATTPCGHLFGAVCLKKYLAMSNTRDPPCCPICRQRIAHRCQHPVLPIAYHPGSAPPSAGDDPRQKHCGYCIKKHKPRRFRRQQSSRSSTSNDTVDGDAAAQQQGKREKVAGMARGILALALHLTRIRRRRVAHLSEAGGSDDSADDDYDENDENDNDDDQPPSPAAAHYPQPVSPGQLPVPGEYGHWDLASTGPDWQYLAWFDKQEPKTKTTAEQLR